MLFFLFPNLFFSQKSEPYAPQSAAITVTGDAVIYNAEQLAVVYIDSDVSNSNKDAIQEKKAAPPLEKNNTAIAKTAFKKEIKEKEEKIRRIAEKLEKRIADFFIPQSSKDFANSSLLEHSVCAIFYNPNQKCSAHLAETTQTLIKKNCEVYSRKVFYYSTHLNLLDFSGQFSVRPPPFNIQIS